MYRTQSGSAKLQLVLPWCACRGRSGIKFVEPYNTIATKPCVRSRENNHPYCSLGPALICTAQRNILKRLLIRTEYQWGLNLLENGQGRKRTRVRIRKFNLSQSPKRIFESNRDGHA